MVRYQERTPSRRAWGIFLGVVVVAWLGIFLIDTSTPWLPTSIVGMIGAIAALAMWSTGFYGNITLTDTQLRVGRARVRIEDVHPWGVSEPGETQGGRLIGGAYAETMGTGVIALTMRNGSRSLVASKNPDALRAALHEVLTPYRTEVR